MRIGILTFLGASNSGALLQAYALRQTLLKMGHEVEFMDYRPDYAGWQPWRNLGIRSCTFHSAIPRRIHFSLFRRRYLPSTPILHNRTEMRSAAEHYDAVIVGSDQVWSGNILGQFDPVYFLDFVPGNACRKISYAACFGQSIQPPETMSRSGSLLRRFDHVSVRSVISRDLVKSLAGLDVPVVGDPTILHDFHEFSRKSSYPQGYVLAYSLAPDKCSTGERIAQKLKAHTGLPLVTVWPTEGFANADRRINVLGPSDWVGILRNASAICTDSFHGSIFAIKFHKPLFAWEGGSPFRLENLMTQCGMPDRLLDPGGDTSGEHLLDKPIDWQKADAGIAELRSIAMNFLEKALS